MPLIIIPLSALILNFKIKEIIGIIVKIINTMLILS
jgi:hypothetical protein